MWNTFRLLLFPVLNALGTVLIAFAALMLVPAAFSWYEGDGVLGDFLRGAAVTGGAGLALWLAFRPFRREMTARHGFLLVTLSWSVTAAFATIPMLMHFEHYGFSEMLFEMMSCLTTTGGTVMTGLDHLPPSVNGWRCLLSWVGGMGLIVLSVAILPLLGVGGAQIMKAETSGPMKETRLTPRIAETARALYLLYLGLSVACAISYHFAGMNWRDAVMHMMTTVSLSGIGAHDESFGFFASGAVDLVAIVFMVASGCNFSLHFLAWRRRSVRAYLRDPEFLSWTGLLGVLTFAVTLALLVTRVYNDPIDALRDAAFAVVSTASTTGFATVDWSLWPLGLPLVILLSSAVASCAGSTGGGLKMFRVLILAKQAKREFTNLLYPNAVAPLTVGGTPISNSIAFAVLAYTLLWFATAFGGTLVLLATGLAPLEACSAAFSSLANLGPGLGFVGPAGNFASIEDFQLDILTFLMLTGRLEIFTVFVLFTRAFWET
ncbi:TrkH family potassium uptake protein [Sutterella sp.]|uniref:TrkH family potassium uptake protein n=1 Tax=Sutterella sp. TaxID=1981025 RepID=UPI0026E0FA6D|nr:potassium transporter TrkG [Sutterella sp.]MDO5530398.1 potassium transporter TrkG [Sutterella sp.]